MEKIDTFKFQKTQDILT